VSQQELVKRLRTVLLSDGSQGPKGVAKDMLSKVLSGPSGRATTVRALRCLPAHTQVKTLSKSLSFTQKPLNNWSYRHWEQLPHAIVFGAGLYASFDELVTAFACACQPLMFLEALHRHCPEVMGTILAYQDHLDRSKFHHAHLMECLSRDGVVHMEPKSVVRIVVASLGWAAEWFVRYSGRHEQMDRVCKELAWRLMLPDAVEASNSPRGCGDSLLHPRAELRYFSPISLQVPSLCKS
jgi:hypothetical protein